MTVNVNVPVAVIGKSWEMLGRWRRIISGMPHIFSARGSALECAAILDALLAVVIKVRKEIQVERELLTRIVSMLSALRRSG